MFSGLPNVVGVGVDLIVKFLVQTSTWVEREEQRGKPADRAAAVPMLKPV